MMMRRTGSILLSLVLAAAPAAAAVTEIPAKYLEHEARILRALSPQARARVDALTAKLTVKMSVADVKALGAGEPSSSVFIFMIEYLKLLNKEARDDQKTARSSQAGALAAKEAKLQLEKEKVEAQKQEAGERYQRAMEAANLEMWMGITSGAAATSAAAAGSRVTIAPTKTPTPRPATEVKIH